MTHTGTFSRQDRRWGAIVFVTGVVLLLFVLWAQWHYIRSNPERTFYGAIENSLKAGSVSKEVTQSAPGQKLQQGVELSLDPHHTARAVTTITEQGENSTVVQTESIGTPKEDYVRYTEIETSQKGASGNALNFSELLNIWGKTQTPDKKQTTGELYGESVLGVVPFGDLSAEKRSQLMGFIRTSNVFQFEEGKVKRQLKDKRPVYTYSVAVSPEAYVGMLKQFAAAVGLTQLENVDPSGYRDAEPIAVQIAVDVWSRQVTSIRYGEGERVEQVGSHGVVHGDIELPKNAIPVQELQERLQAVQ
jgi:hypothetical protein